MAEFSDEASRDWMKLRDAISARRPLNAPIIMQLSERYHLVSGNTRLMVARAAGITPTVLLFTVDTAAYGST